MSGNTGWTRRRDPQIFIDARQLPIGNPNPYFVIRTDGEPLALVPSLRAAVGQLGPHAITDNVATMEQLVANSLARPRLYAVLVGLFASVALVLAAVGLYGVLTYAVTERTREIGIRLALGAAPGRIVRVIVGQGLMVTCAGMVVGIAGATILVRFLGGILFGLSPLDPATFRRSLDDVRSGCCRRLVQSGPTGDARRSGDRAEA